MAHPNTIPKPSCKYQPMLSDTGYRYMSPESLDFQRFWGEEKRRCLEGYKPPDGVWIPGSYYFALNHRPISRLRYDFDPKGMNKNIIARPLYRDGNHFIYENIERRKKENKGGILILKGRQKGITDDMVALLDYTMRFYISAQVSYATPDKDQLANFYVKFAVGYEGVPDAFSQPFKVENMEKRQMGLEYDTPFGKKTLGSESIIFTSAIPKSAVFKGKNFILSVIDEVGMFGKGKKEKDMGKGSKAVTLSQFWGDTVDCWKRGDAWYGFPIFLGTVDQINYAKNTDLEKFWNNPELYDLERLLLPADYMYGNCIDLTTGISDRPAARKLIYAHRKKLDQLEDKTDYWKAVQNNPLNEDELFLITINSFVNAVRIKEQIIRVSNSRSLQEKCMEGELIWERVNNDGKLEYTGGVLFVEKSGGLWRMNYEPINHIYPDTDIVCVDDYMKDDAPNSESLGGILAWRRFINLDQVWNVPTMSYLGRPSKVEDFHDEALKCAVFCKARAAVEKLNEMMKTHFLNSKKVNGRDYLKIFPFVNGKHVKESDAYGYDMQALKAQSIQRLSAWTDSPYIENCFDIRFLKQVAIFGKQNSDLGSAAAVALAWVDDMSSVPVTRADEEEKKGLVALRYEFRRDGVPIQHLNRTQNYGDTKYPKLKWLKSLNKKIS